MHFEGKPELPVYYELMNYLINQSDLFYYNILVCVVKYIIVVIFLTEHILFPQNTKRASRNVEIQHIRGLQKGRIVCFIPATGL